MPALHQQMKMMLPSQLTLKKSLVTVEGPQNRDWSMNRQRIWVDLIFQGPQVEVYVFSFHVYTCQIMHCQISPVNWQLVVGTAIEISLVIVFLLPIKVPFNQRVSHSPRNKPKNKRVETKRVISSHHILHGVPPMCGFWEYTALWSRKLKHSALTQIPPLTNTVNIYKMVIGCLQANPL